jgi:hydrogenase expression/formation protein HypC
VCLAIPCQVVEIVDDDNRLARVDVGGVRRTVNVGLVDGVQALETMRLLQAMGDAYEQELAELRGSAVQ